MKIYIEQRETATFELDEEECHILMRAVDDLFNKYENTPDPDAINFEATSIHKISKRTRKYYSIRNKS